jgi:rhodanese-related sulfurtransferase
MTTPKPKSRIFRRSNLAANIILIVAGLTLTFAVSWRVIRDRTFSAASTSADGKIISISGVNFALHSKTILLALDKDCRFCTQEMPFYHRLVEAARAQDVQLVVVVEHQVEDGKRYLAGERLDVPAIVRIRFKDLGLTGTPTMFLLDDHGQTIGKWFGTLPSQVQEYIIRIMGSSVDTIRSESSPYLVWAKPTPPSIIAIEDFKKMPSSLTTIVDVDDRKSFAKEHLSGAENLPVDEIYARAQNELRMSNTVVLFSRDTDSFRVGNAKVSLERAGFTQVSWLKSSLEECKNTGLQTLSDDSRR